MGKGKFQQPIDELVYKHLPVLQSSFPHNLCMADSIREIGHEYNV